MQAGERGATRPAVESVRCSNNQSCYTPGVRFGPTILPRIPLVAAILVMLALALGGIPPPVGISPPHASEDAIDAGSPGTMPPSDQVQGSAGADLGVALSAAAVRLPVPSGRSPIPPASLGHRQPGFRAPILRPPRLPA